MAIDVFRLRQDIVPMMKSAFILDFRMRPALVRLEGLMLLILRLNIMM
jgi:hypothetical protein